MTTLMDPWRAVDWSQVATTIKDKSAVQVMTRVVSAQRSALESQVAQLKQIEETLEQHAKTLK